MTKEQEKFTKQEDKKAKIAQKQKNKELRIAQVKHAEQTRKLLKEKKRFQKEQHREAKRKLKEAKRAKKIQHKQLKVAKVKHDKQANMLETNKKRFQREQQKDNQQRQKDQKAITKARKLEHKKATELRKQKAKEAKKLAKQKLIAEQKAKIEKKRIAKQEARNQKAKKAELAWKQEVIFRTQEAEKAQAAKLVKQKLIADARAKKLTQKKLLAEKRAAKRKAKRDFEGYINLPPWVNAFIRVALIITCLFIFELIVIFISYVASNEDLFKIITAEGNLTAFGSALIAQFVVFAIMDAIAITLHVLDYKSRESIQARKRMITTRQAVAAYKKMKAENNRNLKMLFEFEEIIEKQQKKLKHLRASLYESHLIAKEAVKLEDQVQFLSKKIKTAQSRVNDLRKKLVFEKMSFEQKIIFVKKVLQAQYSTKSTKHLTADQLKEHRVTEAKQDAKIKEVLAKRCTAEQRDATHELVSVKKLQERYAKEYDRAKKYVDDLIKNHSEQAHKTVIKQQKRIAKRKGREAAHAKREHARKERRLKKEQRRKAKLEKRHSSVTRQKKHSSKLAKQHAKEVKKAQKQHIKAQKLAKKQRERVQKEEQRKKT